MHRLLTMFALSLGCLSFVPQAHADLNAVPKTPPVYLDYIPFAWEDVRAIPRQEFADGLRNAILVGIDKAQAGSTRRDIRQLTTPADIQALRMLLEDPQCPIQALSSYNTRFLFEADNGKMQIFVDTDGVAPQGSHSWRLTSGDFARQARRLDRIYSVPVSK